MVVVSGSHGTTSLSSADIGLLRSGGYGKELKRIVSGAPHGPLQSVSFSETHERRQPLLGFLEDTKVGRMSCQKILEGGSEDDKESLGVLELWPEDAEAKASDSD